MSTRTIRAAFAMLVVAAAVLIGAPQSALADPGAPPPTRAGLVADSAHEPGASSATRTGKLAAAHDPSTPSGKRASLLADSYYDPNCGYTHFCVWYLSGYMTPKWETAGNDDNWGDGIADNPQEVEDDDMSWANNGSPCGGCDHVRVYNGRSRTGGVTLCVHRGQWLEEPSGQVTVNAANRGASHRWGGECGSGEPHIPFG
ncbi:hypothetical protein [Actinoplanes sp. NPDC049265]|uniref:hypothetical protein n=1 Tax=Actinoplanes sp. NPDC049265 TaxID=3363902 RepID=UPI003719317B